MADEPAGEATEAPEAGPGEEAAPSRAVALSPESAAIAERLEGHLGDAIVEQAGCYGDLVVRVRTDAWLRAAEVAHRRLDCDYLSFVSAIDWMPRPSEGGDEEGGDTSAPVQPSEMTFGVAGSAGRFQVLARVQSTLRPRWGITFKADVDEERPEIESWVTVYPGADWHERECWEMFGITFVGHPALRHLYLPSEFEGHPLRKDFALLAREVKPWPGLVDVEDLPPQDEPATAGGDA